MTSIRVSLGLQKMLQALAGHFQEGWALHIMNRGDTNEMMSYTTECHCC